MENDEKEEIEKKEEKPLIYSCSGCSSAAQLANDVALYLDRSGEAEMSCIAGIGGNVKPLLKRAEKSNKRVVIDGCPLQCGRHCFENTGMEVQKHIDLSQFGVKKRVHEKYSEEEFNEALSAVRDMLKEP